MMASDSFRPLSANFYQSSHPAFLLTLLYGTVCWMSMGWRGPGMLTGHVVDSNNRRGRNGEDLKEWQVRVSGICGQILKNVATPGPLWLSTGPSPGGRGTSCGIPRCRANQTPQTRKALPPAQIEVPRLADIPAVGNQGILIL